MRFRTIISLNLNILCYILLIADEIKEEEAALGRTTPVGDMVRAPTPVLNNITHMDENIPQPQSTPIEPRPIGFTPAANLPSKPGTPCLTLRMAVSSPQSL